MTRPSVFITRRWPADAEAAMHADFNVTLNEGDTQLSGDAIAQAMQTHDALAPTVTDPIGAETLAAGAGGKCKIIANFGVGVNHIDMEAARGQGLTVTNTPGVLTDATADIALTLMLMAMRRAGEGEREVRAGSWHGWRPTHLLGQQMTGKTLGIIGMGRIGKATAHRAALGFGMKIVFYNRSPVADFGAFDAEQCASVEAVCRRADIVSLHCPGGAATRHILGAAAIAAMQPHAVVINTARGDVVDEDALAAALFDGRIGGAGLDVFQGEPRINPALMDAPNTVLLPHLGSATTETRTAMGMKTHENLTAFFGGAPVPNPV